MSLLRQRFTAAAHFKKRTPSLCLSHPDSSPGLKHHAATTWPRDPGPAPTFQFRQHFELIRKLVVEVILHTEQMLLVVFHGPQCSQTTAKDASELPALLPLRATPPREPPVPPINSRRSKRRPPLANRERRIFALRGREERTNGSVIEAEDQERFLSTYTVIRLCGRRENRRG